MYLFLLAISTKVIKIDLTSEFLHVSFGAVEERKYSPGQSTPRAGVDIPNIREPHFTGYMQQVADRLHFSKFHTYIWRTLR